MKTTLELNHSYLIAEDRYSNYQTIKKVTVVDSTNECYQLSWEDGRKFWILKSEVAEKWNIIEHLGDFITPLKALKASLDSMITTEKNAIWHAATRISIDNIIKNRVSDWNVDLKKVYITFKPVVRYPNDPPIELSFDGAKVLTQASQVAFYVEKGKAASRVAAFEKENPHIYVTRITIGDK